MFVRINSISLFCFILLTPLSAKAQDIREQVKRQLLYQENVLKEQVRLRNAQNRELERGTSDKIGHNNTIIYISTDGKSIAPNCLKNFGSHLLSNIYSNNEGIITFDDEVNQIGMSSFYRCPTLKSIILPSTVTFIDENAFGECPALESFSAIGCERIGKKAFYGCKSLTDITFSDVQYVEQHAFAECKSLKSITFDQPLVEWGLTFDISIWGGPMNHVDTTVIDLTLNKKQTDIDNPALNIDKKTFGPYTFKSITLK